jgi:tetratricopeptide (TPR) repeat protein
MSRIAGFTVALLLAASVAGAQDWRGTGRLAGKVVDEQGKGIEGVVVNASLPAFHGILAQGKTDKKGEWSIDDVGEGNWELTFESDAYLPAKATSDVDENGRSSPVRTTLKKKFDPNAFIQEEGKKASALIKEKKYADARAVYEGIVAKVPEVSPQIQQFIAQTYYLEGKPDRAAEILKASVAKDPANVGAKVLLVESLLQMGATDEAATVIGGIEESKIPDAMLYADFGVALMKKQKAADALQYLDKAVSRFPQAPEPYYYRALALVDLFNAKTDPKDPEKLALLGKIKADLSKYLQIAPNGPEAENVRKLMEQIDKQSQS